MRKFKFFDGNCDGVIGKKGLLNRLKSFSEIKMKFYFINLSQISTLQNTFFHIMTFKGACLRNNRVPSLNKGTPRVNILGCKFFRIYLLIIKKHSKIFVKIATLVQKLLGGWG